ncbi:PA2778 family cysteine peptidase [Pleionea sediminis]|uniref:PA2778 family cysteine peptidase n=1 Tax=Pleionea sediminis TaxID=2569479 RepID=UPI0011867136|nr:PA2778 family cysteine peptidase [Pleionea sediminis]
MIWGCATPPQTLALQTNPPPVNQRHYIERVPFYAQQQFYCGPTVLAEALSFYGNTVSPEEVAPLMFVPEKEGTFQIELVAAARSKGYLAYQTRGELNDIIQLVSDNKPIIVFQNLSISWFPQWHYALVVGYDLEKQSFTLYSGTYKDYEIPFDVFERTWQRGQFWLLAIVPPDKSSRYFDSFVYTSAAHDLISTNQRVNGVKALKTATKQWPNYWLPYFLLGNHYLSSNLKESLKWYALGIKGGVEEAAYFNNYAYALLKSQQLSDAKSVIAKAIALEPNNENIKDTYQRIIEAMEKL